MSSVAYTPLDAPPTKLKKPSKPCLAEPGATCRLRLHFGVYFDGTNNNRYIDEKDSSHSNVARLYNAAHKDPKNGVHAIYVQGVGTPFKLIGEPVPHEKGSQAGEMGAQRIRYAQIAIANRVARAVGKSDLVSEVAAEMAPAVANDKQMSRLRGELTRLLIPPTSRPLVEEVVLDIFGFSRGAAAARSFLHQFQRNWCMESGRYCGVPLRIRFLGLFDTVASVGFADSFPSGGLVDGHQGWGDQSLLPIPQSVEQCVHLVAGHEGRNSFPVDLVLTSQGSYPPNCVEIVYPGMHSDVGGGYGPKSQGKGSLSNAKLLQTDAHMLSQIALNDMYDRACKAGVALRNREELDAAGFKRDFEISAALRSSFNGYFRAVALEKKNLPATKHYLAHRRFYLGWRKQILNAVTFEGLSFVRAADRQDKVNLIQANSELRAYVTKLSRQSQALKVHTEKVGPRAPPPMVDSKGVPLYRNDWVPAPVPPEQVAAFLSQYVHDSRAGFLLTDPISEHDHRVIRERLEKKDKQYQDQLKELSRKYEQIRASPRAYLSPTDARALAPPVDPLSAQERKNLEIYRKGGKPIYTDENPAFRSDGDSGVKHLVLAAMDGRRENWWSYLHPRQMFAYNRIRYHG